MSREYPTLTASLPGSPTFAHWFLLFSFLPVRNLFWDFLAIFVRGQSTFRSCYLLFLLVKVFSGTFPNLEDQHSIRVLLVNFRVLLVKSFLEFFNRFRRSFVSCFYLLTIFPKSSKSTLDPLSTFRTWKINISFVPYFFSYYSSCYGILECLFWNFKIIFGLHLCLVFIFLLFFQEV